MIQLICYELQDSSAYLRETGLTKSFEPTRVTARVL
jgi:hypothetical protein